MALKTLHGGTRGGKELHGEGRLGVIGGKADGVEGVMQTVGPSLQLAELTGAILGASYEVHSALGPGLLESTYRACLAHLLQTRGHVVAQEVPVPIRFRNLEIEASYRADLIVDGCVLVELKAVERLSSIHEAQILTYLRHSGLKVGLLMNFNVTRLKPGIRRFIR